MDSRVELGLGLEEFGEVWRMRKIFFKMKFCVKIFRRGERVSGKFWRCWWGWRVAVGISICVFSLF